MKRIGILLNSTYGILSCHPLHTWPLVDNYYPRRGKSTVVVEKLPMKKRQKGSKERERTKQIEDSHPTSWPLRERLKSLVLSLRQKNNKPFGMNGTWEVLDTSCFASFSLISFLAYFISHLWLFSHPLFNLHVFYSNLIVCELTEVFPLSVVKQNLL